MALRTASCNTWDFRRAVSSNPNLTPSIEHSTPHTNVSSTYSTVPPISPSRNDVNSSTHNVDNVEQPPHKPSPTPFEISCLTRRVSHDACETQIVTKASSRQASMLAPNVAIWNALSTPRRASGEGNAKARPKRMAAPTKPPTNTTKYNRPSASGLNCACTRFTGASGICGGCSAAAAPVGCGMDAA